MDFKSGDELTIEPFELVAGGEALAKIDGYPIFASNVFPRDVARVRLYDVKKGFAKAEMVEILTPSPFRRAAPCPIANECGGCDWTALRLDKQLEAKQRILTESLRRIGKFDPATLPSIDVHVSPLNYRLRSRLHVQDEKVGFYAMRSTRVVPLVEECEVVGLETARYFGRGTLPDEARRALYAGEDGNAAVSAWELDERVLLDQRDQTARDRELTIHVDRFTYRLAAGAFFQVNRHLLPTMLRLVSAHAARTTRKRLAVDLYAGVGFFTLPLAEIFERVVAVEGSPIAVRYSRKNVPHNVKILQAPVENSLHRVPNPDFLFLDPPRAGAKREVIVAAAEKTRERIAYLSCDPVTFSRDAQLLAKSGWRLATLDLLDLFPNTHHVETLGSFERVQRS